jgi:hypothetical protein
MLIDEKPDALSADSPWRIAVKNIEDMNRDSAPRHSYLHWVSANAEQLL